MSKLTKLNPQKSSDNLKGEFKTCSNCQGQHMATQIKSVGKETDFGLWFMCACGTAVLWSKHEQANPEVKT